MDDELTETLRRLLRRSLQEGEQVGEVVGEDLYVKVFAGGVVNISGRGRDLTTGDVAAMRAVLGELGYAEVRSWHATQGTSWLSPGLSAGVSFEVRRRELTERR